MKKFAFTNAAGEPSYIANPSVDDMYQAGETYGEHVCREIPLDADDMAVLATWYWAGAWKTRAPCPGRYHHWDPLVEQWVIALSDAKADRWATIKAARAAAEFGGFSWGGSAFDSDALSQSRVMGAVQLAQLDPGFTIAWTLADNSVRILNAQDMVAVGVALGQHVAVQHEKARALRAQIEAAQTAAEVAAVTW